MTTTTMTTMTTMFRHLQVATVGNDRGGDHNTPLYLPYGVGIFMVFGLLLVVGQIAHYYICKFVCGREDPIDAQELLSELTEDQRRKVLVMVVAKGSSTATKTMEQTGDKGLLLSSSAAAASDANICKKGGSDPTLTTLEEGGMAEEVDQNDENNPDSSTGSDIENVHICEDTCPICLGGYEDSSNQVEMVEEDDTTIFSSQHCFHKFHARCILEWFQSKERKDCPVCRTQVITEEDMVTAALELVKKEKDDEI